MIIDTGILLRIRGHTVFKRPFPGRKYFTAYNAFIVGYRQTFSYIFVPTLSDLRHVARSKVHVNSARVLDSNMSILCQSNDIISLICHEICEFFVAQPCRKPIYCTFISSKSVVYRFHPAFLAPILLFGMLFAFFISIAAAQHFFNPPQNDSESR